MERQLRLHLLFPGAPVLGGVAHLSHSHLFQSQVALFLSLQKKCECAWWTDACTYVHVLETEVLMYVHGVQSIGNTLVARVYVHIT